MANCKICGRPVVAGPVMHGECLEQAVSDAVEQFCDSYCTFRIECTGAEELQKFCEDCPANQLMELTKQEDTL